VVFKEALGVVLEQATIFVQVIHGSSPDGLRGLFAAFTTGIYDVAFFLDGPIDGIGHQRIMLVESKGEKLPTAGDGNIKLSRACCFCRN
jgi:hypothetical protein